MVGLSNSKARLAALIAFAMGFKHRVIPSRAFEWDLTRIIGMSAVSLAPGARSNHGVIPRSRTRCHIRWAVTAITFGLSLFLTTLHMRSRCQCEMPPPTPPTHPRTKSFLVMPKGAFSGSPCLYTIGTGHPPDLVRVVSRITETTRCVPHLAILSLTSLWSFVAAVWAMRF